MSTRLEEKDFNDSLKKSFGKSLARYLSKKCDQCGKERFLSAVDYYLSKKQKCIQCQVTSYVMWPIIHLFFRKLSFSPETARKILDDTLLRKTMLNVIKGLALFGIKNPQPTHVPVVIVWNFTNRCNLNCLHCHQSSTLLSQERELTTDEAFKIASSTRSDAELQFN